MARGGAIAHCALALLVALPAAAASLNEHERRWNAFVQGVYELHRAQIAQREVQVERRVGGYAHLPDFYLEESFRDAATGRLLSRIQWERDSRQNIHVIEVFVHDAQGRLARDYAAAFLPYYRRAPTQTLMSFHRYQGDLHGFRTFDASGDRVFERCQGRWEGRDIDLMLDEEAISAALHAENGPMQGPLYQACFAGLPRDGEQFLPLAGS